MPERTFIYGLLFIFTTIFVFYFTRSDYRSIDIKFYYENSIIRLEICNPTLLPATYDGTLFLYDDRFLLEERRWVSESSEAMYGVWIEYINQSSGFRITDKVEYLRPSMANFVPKKYMQYLLPFHCTNKIIPMDHRLKNIKDYDAKALEGFIQDKEPISIGITTMPNIQRISDLDSKFFRFRMHILLFENYFDYKKNNTNEYKTFISPWYEYSPSEEPQK